MQLSKELRILDLDRYHNFFEEVEDRSRFEISNKLIVLLANSKNHLPEVIASGVETYMIGPIVINTNIFLIFQSFA